jgi:hypothetical protein
MKNRRFLGSVLAGFIIFSMSCSSAFAAEIGDLADDAEYSIKLIGDDVAVDSEGNVIRNLSKDEVDAIKSGKVRTLKSLHAQFDKSQFLEADSPVAQKYIARNKALIDATDKLDVERIDIDPAQDGVAGDVKPSADAVIIQRKTLGATEDARNAMQDCQKQMAKDLKNNADLFKGPPPATADELRSKCIDSLNGINGQQLKGLEQLGIKGGSGAEFKSLSTEIESAKTVDQLRNLKLKIDKLDALGTLGRKMDTLDSTLADVDKNALKSKINGFADDLDNVKIKSSDLMKDATDAEVSGLDSALSKMKSAGEKTLSRLDDKISQMSANVDESMDALGISDKAAVRKSRVFSNIRDSAKSFKKYLNNDLSGDLSDGFCSAGRKLKSAGGKVLTQLEEAGKMIFAGVLFMIPNIFQSSFLAEKQRQVELQTLAAVIEVDVEGKNGQQGKWVFQIPDSCFNFDNPQATIPIYVGIPVNSSSDELSPTSATNAAVYKHFHGSVSGPSTHNAVSAAIHSVGNAIFTFGGGLAAKPKRYNIREGQYFTYNPSIILTYFSGNYQPWGSVAATSSQFTSGQFIDVKSGIIGDQISATTLPGFDAYPLIPGSLGSPAIDWHIGQLPQPPFPLTPTSIKDFLPTIKSKLVLSGDKVQYTQYTNVGSGSAGAKGSDGLKNLFDCSCLQDDGNSICTPGSGNCLISKIVGDYSSGLSLNADGSVGLQNAPVLTAASKPNMLGPVMPMFGWGSTKLSEIINDTTFPNHPALNLGQSTVGKLGTNPTTGAGTTAYSFAIPEAVYSAEGCWVYLSTQTPFAQALLGNASNNDLTGPYVDYIIFLDDNNTIVPLMVPVQKIHETLSYTSTGLGLNPVIKYWTSIAAFNNSTGQALSCMQAPNGNSVKYDLQGNAYEDPNLGGVANSKTPPGTAIISAAISDLQNSFSGEPSNLYGQFAVHQTVMMNKFTSGPFEYGSDSLTLSSYNITVPGATATAAPQAEINLYQGGSCYGTTVQDLFVAMDSVSGNSATLPDVNATEFYSLITDIAYTLENGTLVPSDFSNAPLTQTLANSTYSLDSSKISTFNTLGMLESSLVSSAPLPAGTTSYVTPELQKYALTQRKKWTTSFDPSAQKQGVAVGKLTCSMPALFKTKAAIAAQAFIYEIKPNPSAAFTNKDLFVLVSGKTPALSSLKPISAQFANPKTITAVSLMTGFLFDMQGNQIMNGTAPARLTVAAKNSGKAQGVAKIIYDAISKQFDVGTVADPKFATMYQNWVKAYEKQMERPVGPYTFGDLSLGIYAGDLAIGNYVYFNASGMHAQDFEPSDIFVTYDGTSHADKLTADTTHMLSLVSGNLYDATGVISGYLPAATLLSTTDSISVNWGTWLKSIVKQRQQSMAARLQAANAEREELDNVLKSIATQHAINSNFALPATVQKIIARLTPGDASGLAAPYGLLQYDPIQEHYVHVSPASGSDAGNLLYLFFDVGVDNATSKSIGAIYTAGGNIVRVVKGVQLDIIKREYGVVVNSDGTQKLGIPLTQPSFALTADDMTFAMGSNSADGDLISSQSALFPGGPVAMPNNYFLYYSVSMQAYYVYDLKNKQWMSVDGGHLYAVDGAPIPFAQKVAYATSASSANIKVKDDMILLYENTHGNVQGYMSDGQNYVNIDQTSGTMNWTNLNSDDDTSLIVKQKGNSYTVTDASADIVYKVSTEAVWHSLFAVPIDAAGTLNSISTSSAYQNAQLVVVSGKPAYLLFNEVMYKVSTADATMFVPVDKTKTNSIKVGFEVDADTQAPYVFVHDGKKGYRYLYVMNSLDQTEQDLYRAKFAGSTTASTIAFAVGEVTSVTQPIGGKSVTISVPNTTTHVLYVKDIPLKTLTAVSATSVLGIPEKTSPAYKEFAITASAFYENLSKVLSSSDGRFFVELQPYSSTNANSNLAFSYVSNGAYVDLATGVLYDATHGIGLGYCLNLDDWLAVLNTVSVSVIPVASQTSATPKMKLSYRSPQAINVQATQVGVNESTPDGSPSRTASIANVNVMG